MKGHARQRDLGDAVATALKQRAGPESRRHRQPRTRRDRTETVDHPRPLEFDENGFPVAQRTPSFVNRVTRLLNPS